LRDAKENLLIENGLQGQKNTLYSTRQLLGEFKALILEKLSKRSFLIYNNVSKE